MRILQGRGWTGPARIYRSAGSVRRHTGLLPARRPGTGWHRICIRFSKGPDRRLWKKRSDIRDRLSGKQISEAPVKSAVCCWAWMTGEQKPVISRSSSFFIGLRFLCGLGFCIVLLVGFALVRFGYLWGVPVILKRWSFLQI